MRSLGISRLYFFVFLIVLNALVTTVAGAEDAAKEPAKKVQKEYEKPPVIVSKVAGQPITVSWSDGREAVVQSYVSAAKSVDTPIQVIENLCNDNSGMAGIFSGQYLVGSVRLVWTKHSDATKIGKIVRYRNYEKAPFFEVAEDKFVNYPLRVLMPILTQELTDSEEITMKDYSWVPGGSVASPPEKAFIVNWSNEFMFPNIETGVTENHAESGMLGVEFVKGPKGNIKIAGIKEIASAFEFIPVSVGDTISLFFQAELGKDELCQVTVKPKLGPARKAVEETIKENKAHAMTPYIYGSNELYAASKDFRRFIGELYQKRASPEPEDKNHVVYVEAETE